MAPPNSAAQQRQRNHFQDNSTDGSLTTLYNFGQHDRRRVLAEATLCSWGTTAISMAPRHMAATMARALFSSSFRSRPGGSGGTFTPLYSLPSIDWAESPGQRRRRRRAGAGHGRQFLWRHPIWRRQWRRQHFPIHSRRTRSKRRPIQHRLFISANDRSIRQSDHPRHQHTGAGQQRGFLRHHAIRRRQYPGK